MIDWLNQRVIIGFIIRPFVLLWPSSTGSSSYCVLAGLLYNSIHHQSISRHRRKQDKRPIIRHWERDLYGFVIDWRCLCDSRSNVFTVIFGKNNLNKYIRLSRVAREGWWMMRVNALGQQAPHPLICRTALSVSVCMATPAPHYSFSCCLLSVCWWRSLPLKDLEGAFGSPSKTPTGSLRCEFWAVKPLNCSTCHISYESILDEELQSLS